MSWPPPEKTTAATAIDAACAGAVRRMVNLPRSVIGEVSRAVSQGFDIFGNMASRRHHLPPAPPQSYHWRQDITAEVEWKFLQMFESNFGTVHPFFYSCSFGEVLKMGEDEGKPVFLYLHSSAHPFTSYFCSNTLCCEALVEFFDANFISWGGFSGVGEGLRLSHFLRPSSFPFSAFLSSSSGGALTLLRQMEGPISTCELIEIGQSILGGERGDFISLREMRGEEQRGLGEVSFVEEEKEKDEEIKVEDGGSLHFSSLQINEEEETCESSLRTRRRHNKHQHSMMDNARSSCGEGSEEQIQMLIRLPDGDRIEKCFCKEDKISSLYAYIDALELPGLGSYRLVSYFPKRVFDTQTQHLSLSDAGFHTRTTLFVKTDSYT